jgi:GNAT superfamily N-acetyltransferase
MSTPLHFDADYREEATLADGTPVLLRLVQPADRDLLREGFQQLSPASRYLRFFTPKADLTEDELTRLTTLDGINQLALGAERTGPEGTVQGLGIARFVRDPANPAVAEAAVTVTDAVQGLGLGTLLLDRLAQAAAERGVTRFRGEFLAGNERVRALIEEACPTAHLTPLGDTIRAEIPLGEARVMPEPPGRRLLAHVAGGRLALRLRHLLLKDS